MRPLTYGLEQLAKSKKRTRWISSGTRGFPSSDCSEFGFFGLFSLRLRDLQFLRLNVFHITTSGLAKQALNSPDGTPRCQKADPAHRTYAGFEKIGYNVWVSGKSRLQGFEVI